jgi:hypothetical protein
MCGAVGACGAKQAAGKGVDLKDRPEKHTSGAEAPINSVGLMRGLKTPASLRFEFFRSP